MTVVPTAAALQFVGAPTWSALSGKPVSTEVWDERPRGAARPDRPVGRPGRGRAGDRRPAGQGRARPGRRPAHQHPAHRPVPGRVRARDAHRDVGARRHAGERRDAARARLPGHRARRGPADRRRLRQGPAARPRRDLRRVPRRARARRAARRTWPAARWWCRPVAPGSTSTRSASSATAPRGCRATRWPGPPPPAAPRSPWSPRTPRCPTRPASRWSASRPPSSCAPRCWPRPRSADAVVMAAAPADFRPTSVSDAKIKKADDGSAPPLELTQNPDILHELSTTRPRAGAVIVGFAAETGDATGTVLELGRAKLARKGCDLLVVNDVSGGASVRQRRERGRRSSAPTARRPRSRAAPRPPSPTSFGTKWPRGCTIEPAVGARAA